MKLFKKAGLGEFELSKVLLILAALVIMMVIIWKSRGVILALLSKLLG